MLKAIGVAIGLTVLATCVIGAKAAEARTHYKHYTFQRAAVTHAAFNDSSRSVRRAAGRQTKAARRLTRAHRHRHYGPVDANGNRGFAEIRTKSGQKAVVIASAKDQFQGLVNDIERDRDEIDGTPIEQPIPGNAIKDIGCKSSGHMPGSKHYWGGACDIMQTARNKTAAFMYSITDLARKRGLTDGCTWGFVFGQRYTGPDCGHVEVAGPNRARSNPSYRLAMGLNDTRTYAARRHHHKIRMAR